MNVNRLAIAWVVVAAAFLILLGAEFSKWGSLTAEGARAAAERQRLITEIQSREQQVGAEMSKHGGLLQEMQWTASGADPSAFLTRLAELAQEKRMKIMGIGPLERQATPQFNKSWHTIQVQGPYREIRELALRVEQDKGILEDVRLEAAPAPPGPAGAAASPSEDIQARFKMAALDLSAQAKQIIARTVAAGGSGGQLVPGPQLALSVPARTPEVSPLARDPFVFLTPPRPTIVSTGADKPAVPLELKGIVSFPGGFLAVINNQILKVGDTVSGHDVLNITENSVTLREPGKAPRTIDLPEVVHTISVPGR